MLCQWRVQQGDKHALLLCFAVFYVEHCIRMKTKQPEPVQVRIVGDGASKAREWAEVTGWSEAKLVTMCVLHCLGNGKTTAGDGEFLAFLRKVSDAHGQVLAAEKIAKERRQLLQKVEVGT